MRRTLKWVFDPNTLKGRKTLLRTIGLATISLASFSLKGFLDFYKDNESLSDLSAWTASFLPETLSAPLRSDPLLPPAFNLLALMLVVGAVVVLTMIAKGFWKSRKRPLPLSKFCRPDDTASKLLEKQGTAPEDYAICGSVIEICRSKNIFTDLAISGWDCRPSDGPPKVTIRHKSGTGFLHAPFLEYMSDPESIGFNGKKYSLVETPPNFLGAEDVLTLTVQDTDFRSVEAVQKAIRAEPQLTLEEGSIFPETQRCANSLCLHMLVQLADGNIICMKRASNTAYAADRMSISCEEQLAFEDMCVPDEGKVGHWFKRALCEEIFPLGALQAAQLEMNWKKIEKRVTSMRVLSVFYEVGYINYAIFGYCRINCTTLEFRDLYRELAVNRTGRDKEGNLYLLSESEALDFVLTGRSKVRSLWGSEQIAFGEGTGCAAHSSSLYRLVQFLSATGALRPNMEVRDVAKAGG